MKTLLKTITLLFLVTKLLGQDTGHIDSEVVKENKIKMAMSWLSFSEDSTDTLTRATITNFDENGYILSYNYPSTSWDSLGKVNYNWDSQIHFEYDEKGQLKKRTNYITLKPYFDSIHRVTWTIYEYNTNQILIKKINYSKSFNTTITDFKYDEDSRLVMRLTSDSVGERDYLNKPQLSKTFIKLRDFRFSPDVWDRLFHFQKINPPIEIIRLVL
ncbi:MAG: hypothetical protein JKY52_07300 [Flavobacteriales bacterium]|nr:hypothetical protein [Flavobacteriales bacterium]